MKTEKLEDLYDITEQAAMVIVFEQHFFAVARHLSKDYDGGYWQSKTVGNGWCFLLDADENFKVDDCVVNSKTFSFIVGYIVLVDILNAMVQKGLEADSLYQELQRLWMNANEYIPKVLSRNELTQYYTILD